MVAQVPPEDADNAEANVFYSAQASRAGLLAQRAASRKQGLHDKGTFSLATRSDINSFMYKASGAAGGDAE
jgi:hypothetical protein